MTISLELITLGLGLVFVAVVLRSLVLRKLSERNSLFWLSGALFILFLGAFPQVMDLLARAVGVAYAPALLFLVSTLVILTILMHQSIELSVLQARLRETAQQLAVMRHKQATTTMAVDHDSSSLEPEQRM